MIIYNIYRRNKNELILYYPKPERVTFYSFKIDIFKLLGIENKSIDKRLKI